MARKKNRPTTVTQPKAQVATNENPKETDWWSRGLAILSLVLSIVAIVLGVIVARWNSPYFFAAPQTLSYVFVQSNIVDDEGRPQESKLAVRIRNSAKTPARDIRVSVLPITSNPEILCDQKATVHKGPWDVEIVNIERIPAEGEALLVYYRRN